MSSRPPRKPGSRARGRFSMRSPRSHHRLGMGGRLALLILLAAYPMSRPALAQPKPAPAKAAGVFDDEKKAPAAKPPAAAKGPTVTDRDTIGFTQENVAAQMTELEERMFRLSEALRGLEPENASRL